MADTEALPRDYDRRAETARQLALSQPKDILRAWAKSFLAGKRETTPRLAFLGGHPRSGTTLLEQVLDAHPDVAALDEPRAFAQVIEPAFGQTPELPTARLNVPRRLYPRALLNETGADGTGKLLLALDIHYSRASTGRSFGGPRPIRFLT